MLALGSYNPAIITILVDRYKFCLHHATLEDKEWDAKLRDFLEGASDGREKVVLFDSVSLLQKAQQLSGDPDVKSIVFDTPKMLKALPDVRVLDLEHKEGTVYQQRVVDVDELNSAISSTEGDFLVDIQDVTDDEDTTGTSDLADEPVEDPPDDAPYYELKPDALSGILAGVLSTMAADVRPYFRERALLYLTGQVSSRALGGAKRKARNAGSPKAELDKLTKHLNSDACISVSDAFYAVSVGLDPEDACSRSGAQQNELNYVLAYLDPDEAEFERDPPAFLKSDE